MKSCTLRFDAAMAAMRRPGARLVHMDGRGGGFFVVPGGEVAPAIADQIKKHPLVRSGYDGLWPGHGQTWRMIVDGGGGP